MDHFFWRRPTASTLLSHIRAKREAEAGTRKPKKKAAKKKASR